MFTGNVLFCQNNAPSVNTSSTIMYQANGQPIIYTTPTSNGASSLFGDNLILNLAPSSATTLDATLAGQRLAAAVASSNLCNTSLHSQLPINLGSTLNSPTIACNNDSIQAGESDAIKKQAGFFLFLSLLLTSF